MKPKFEGHLIAGRLIEKAKEIFVDLMNLKDKRKKII